MKENKIYFSGVCYFLVEYWFKWFSYGYSVIVNFVRLIKGIVRKKVIVNMIVKMKC